MARIKAVSCFFLCVLTLAAGVDFNILSADEGGISFISVMSDVEITEDGGYSLVQIEDAGRVSNPGDPDLPLASEYLLLAESGTPLSFAEALVTDTIYALPPAPTDVPYFESGEPDGIFPGESRIYQTDEIWPRELVSINYIGAARGVPIGLMTLCPVRYHFGLGAYLIHRRMRVVVDLGGDIQAPPERLRSRPFLDMLSRFALNGHLMPTTISNDAGTYLIISPDNCWDVMEEFAAHKRSRGHRVVMTRLSDLGSPPDKFDIKDHIQEAYDNMNPAPTFVVLVGDVTMNDGTAVPDYKYGIYYSGHGYSLLEGDDYFSDLFYARWPIDNANECRILNKKTQWYETTPTSGGTDWLTRGAVVSTYDHAVTPVWNVLWVYELLLRNGYTRVDSFFEHGSVIPTPAEIAAPINDGLAYIDYRGWAGSNGWWEPEFTVTNVMMLSNSEAYPVISSIVCGSGDYGAFTDPCFGEAWLRAGTVTNPRGAVAFYGTTDHDTHTRYNNPINGGFFEGIFVHNLPYIGQNEWLSKAECLRLHPTEVENIELFFYSYCTLGDPGLMLQRNIPGILTVVHDSIYNGASVSVEVYAETGPVKDAAVCLMRIGTGEQSLAYTDFSGRAELYVPGSGDGEVVLTAYAPFHTIYIDTVEVGGRPKFRLISYAIEDTISGDGDSILDPDETAVLRVTIENTHGMAISPVEAYLWAEHRGVTVTSEFDSITIAAHTDEEFVFIISALGMASGGGPAEMKLYCDSRNGRAMIPFDIPLPPGTVLIDSIRVNDSAGGDGDGKLEPGETGLGSIQFSNTGAGTAEGFEIISYSTGGWLSVGGDTVTVPPIPAGENRWSGDFELNAVSSAFHGYPVPVEIHNSESGRLLSIVDLRLGTRNSDDPQGSDDWGYFAFDNTDISAGIIPCGFDDITATGSFDAAGDDIILFLPLPFDFVFYGESYDTLTVCSNGWAAPGTQPYFMLNFYNNPIPAPNGPWGTLALFWDDLEPSASGTSGIYWESRPADGEFIVQWENMAHARYDGVSNTFQLVIFDPSIQPTRTGDSPIEFRYSGTIEDLDTTEEGSTVGIESPNHIMGIEYYYSGVYDDGAAPLGDGRSIRFTTNCGAGLLTGNIDMGGALPTEAVVSTDAGQIARPNIEGDYRLLELPPGSYHITCSAPLYFPDTSSLIIAANEHDTLDFALVAVPAPGNIEASAGVLSGITVEWSLAPTSEKPLTGYTLLKYLAPGGIPEEIELTDTIYTDTDCETGRKYWYRVRYDYSGNIGPVSEQAEGWLDINTDADEIIKPEEFSLSFSPNPFNPALYIKISTPVAGELEIFDITGRRVHFSPIPAGESGVNWCGVSDAGVALPNGVYFIRMSSEDREIRKKAVLLK